MPDDEDVAPDENGGDGGGTAAVRPFWSGTITFGLVSVPVNLYSAQRSSRVSLRMLSPEGRPLRRRYVCPEHGREVGYDEIVRGYPMDGDDFVVVQDEELESLQPEKSRDIDLKRFVPREQIDPKHFVRAYFLAPAGETTKAYRLLAAVMERKDVAGIATFVMRGREYLVAIMAENGILRAETMRFSDEIRSPADVGLPSREEADEKAVKRRARQVAEALSEAPGGQLEMEELRDRWADRLLELVERKKEEGEGVVRPSGAAAREEGRGDVIDLMEALKRRIGRGEDGQGAERTRSEGRAGRPSGDGAAPEAARDEDLAERTKDELYERARDLDIPGRSRMSKDELIRAIRDAS